MITMKEFDQLQIGSELEMKSAFPFWPKEKTKLKVVQVDDQHTKIEFLVKWCGIVLGRWVLTDDKGTLKWSI